MTAPDAEQTGLVLQLQTHIVVPTCGPDGVAVAAQEVQFHWHPAQPLVVELFLPHRSGAGRVWQLSRDLLADGVRGAAGLGDVCLIPNPYNGDVLELVLANHRGECATVLINREMLAHFIATTEATVPRGDEQPDIPDTPEGAAL